MKRFVAVLTAVFLTAPAWASANGGLPDQAARRIAPVSTTSVECPVNPPAGRPIGFVEAPGMGRFAAYGPRPLVPIGIILRADGGTELHFAPAVAQNAELQPIPFRPSSYDADSATTLDSTPTERASTGEIVWSFDVQSPRWEIAGLVADMSWGEPVCLYSDHLTVTAAK